MFDNIVLFDQLFLRRLCFLDIPDTFHTFHTFHTFVTLGKCVNLEEAAAQRTSNGISAPTTYGATQAAGTWDRRKIYGCLCYDRNPLYVLAAAFFFFDCSFEIRLH